MILIKDRHRVKIIPLFFRYFGKYDTYKGSTQKYAHINNIFHNMGNMILIGLLY